MNSLHSMDDYQQLKIDLISDGFIVECLGDHKMSVKGNVNTFDITYLSQQKSFEVMGSGRVLHIIHNRHEVENFLNLMNVM